MNIVEQHKSLTELYADLLKTARGFRVQLDSGKASCEHCSRTKGEHLPDMRCSCSALSRQFRPRFFAEMERVERALALIEELQSL